MRLCALEGKLVTEILQGFDLPPEFTEGRTLREKRRVNYGYDDYDQEIKAAIRAHNSPFKDATSLCKSDTDDLSSSATYSPSKYGFRLIITCIFLFHLKKIGSKFRLSFSSFIWWKRTFVRKLNDIIFSTINGK